MNWNLLEEAHRNLIKCFGKVSVSYYIPEIEYKNAIVENGVDL